MTNDRVNFQALVERAIGTVGRTHMRPVIEKELLHYDILFALDNGGLLDQLTFQGGTCLRLCYGALRFSEDLDFVGGRDFATATLLQMKSCLEHYIGGRYGLEVTVKEPKDIAKEPEYRDIKVDKWQIRVVMSLQRPDLPKQMIKIEVANIPAYSREPRSLMNNYDFLPDGYGDILILVESLDEIMADKLVSFVDCRYIRYRDIWDLHWLGRQGAVVNMQYVQGKIGDYKVENYDRKVDSMSVRLPDIIHGKDFSDQMSRFLPMDTQERTMLKDKFLVFLEREMMQLFRDVRERLH